MKAILIDDEKNALEILALQLQKHCPQVEIVAQCQGAQQGIEAIKQLEPSIVFLDIEMPRMNGFDLLQQFPDPAFSVVFTTAYDQFALKAIKFAALDYLLKPIDAADLVKAIARYEKTKQRASSQQLESLFNQLKPKRSTLVKLSVNEGFFFVDPASIIHIESSSNYCWVYFTERPKLLMAKTLKDLEEILPAADFYRVHNSHLVNLNHINRYVKTDGGYLEMKDGTQISISRQKKEDFLNLFSGRNG